MPLATTPGAEDTQLEEAWWCLCWSIARHVLKEVVVRQVLAALSAEELTIFRLTRIATAVTTKTVDVPKFTAIHAPA